VKGAVVNLGSAIATLAALVATIAGASAAATAATTEPFRAELHEADVCAPGIDLCGKGVVHGFGQATTTLMFTSIAPGPGETCVTGTADRAVVLDGDGSTLQLEIAGTICRQKIEGTYEVVGGTGSFAGAAGGGTVRGIAIPGEPGGTVHLVGTLTLP
jgi:hypothetical protein